MPNVKDLDGNIIERSLEQTIEQTTLDVFESSFTQGSSSSNVQSIFKHWQSVMHHPRAKLDIKRKRRIVEALKNYSEEELKQAINGCANTPYNMGDNDSRQRYDDIELILRDASRIERFMRNAINPPSVSTKANNMTTDIMVGVI